MGVRFYNTDIFEFLKAKYFDNNTLLKTEAVLASFSFEFQASFILLGTPVLKLYQVNEADLKLKIMTDYEVETLSITTLDYTYYRLKEATARRGIYRYKISYSGDDAYWSDLFCIEDENSYLVTETVQSGLLKLYNADYFEFSSKDYLTNNSYLKLEAYTAPINFISSTLPISAQADLYQIDESTLNTKVIIENKVDEIALSFIDYNIYKKRLPITKRGMFRYKILINSTIEYWSEIFCIKDAETVNGIIKLESGLLKAYYGNFLGISDAGYFENMAKDYLNNNSFLKLDGKQAAFYFNYLPVTSTISSIIAYIMKLDTDALKKGVLNENNIGQISVGSIENQAYIKNQTSEKEGIFRYKVVINGSEEIYSDLFCVISSETISPNSAQFGDGSYIQFSDGGYMQFTV